ncbi:MULTISPECIES: DUF5049 domain-containing protein [Lactococcus]|jgi:hypothetical protein|uniref:DUF5049 domain-containing protein n=1 Tax=Streptococcaceae TaxID=1300 RepID=UPI0006D10EBA|nr:MULTISPECIES: DUF5049 domain-containing protein [Lactococcus]
MTDTIFEQIMAIRESGEINMLDVNSVQRLAFEQNFHELVDFIEEDKQAYWNFIMTGNRGDSSRI